MEAKKTSLESVVTKSQIKHDLTAIGVLPGQSIMIHVSVRAIGWIIGGPDVLIQALLDCVGHQGTIMAYASWEERPDDFSQWSDARKTAFLSECPPFDPRTSRAYRKWSIVTEYMRTWKGACRSGNPGASMVAVGAKAKYLTKRHPLQYGYGSNSPLDKLCKIDGNILQIGVEPSTLTMLHHAEHLSRLKNKKVFKYRAPFQKGRSVKWIQIEEYDTGDSVVAWKGGDYFETIASEFRKSEKGITGRIGNADSFMCKARELRDFAVQWMESNLL